MFALNDILINLFLSFYLLFTLQSYNYSFYRILFHFHKLSWHLYFLVVPLAVYELSVYYREPLCFLFFAVFIYSPLVYMWDKKLSKRLVFTARIKTFLMVLFATLVVYISFVYKTHEFLTGVEPLVLALIFSYIFEFYKMKYFVKQARKKLSCMKDLKIVLITASFGKTSMKNFLFQLLEDFFICHKTPRSVNTFTGIIQDINTNLSTDTKIYIVEAGARQSKDILQITEFLNPEYVIVGEIGKAHLEYFKSEENIRKTKLEALQSKRLKTALLHSSTKVKEAKMFYDSLLTDVNASLEGLSFCLEIDGVKERFFANLLGAFNAQNLAACIYLAHLLGVQVKDLRKSALKIAAIKHRLELLSTKPKLIIDDSFNGNLQGMSASYALCKPYPGRKVVITPGIVEVNEEENIALAKLINESFDFAILTSKTNSSLIASYLDIDYFILKDKSLLTKTLGELTLNGDLILFSNDAPSFF